MPAPLVMRSINEKDAETLLAAVMSKPSAMVFRQEGGWISLALRYRNIELSDCLSKEITQSSGSEAPLFRTGYILLWPYAAGDQNYCALEPEAFHISHAVHIHLSSGAALFCGTGAEELFESVDEHLVRPAMWSAHLRSDTDHASYQKSVSDVLRDIVNGRYYQLNLLRYFDVSLEANSEGFVQKFLYSGGDFSFWWKSEACDIFSLSPERFVRTGAGYIDTFPIKGSARFEDAASRLAATQRLLASSKDRAELNMIIDLLRNDLRSVCEEGSVQVCASNLLVSAHGVMHTAGHIRGRLRSELVLGDLVHSLAPGGSITGAPKREVMRGIAEYEQQMRGFFMGNVFYLDEHSRRLDSNILIRTMVRTQHGYRYAAGSGIGIMSDPILEQEEVEAKCKVINDPIFAVRNTVGSESLSLR